LRGMGWGRITSNALTRSLATIKSWPSPTSKTSRTFPRWRCGRGICGSSTPILSDSDIGFSKALVGTGFEAYQGRLYPLGEEAVDLFGSPPDESRGI
jgi:hypothetical protein